MIRADPRRSHAQGRLRFSDADLAAQTLWSAIHGVVALIDACPTFPFLQPRLLIDTMIQTVLRGMILDDVEGA